MSIEGFREGAYYQWIGPSGYYYNWNSKMDAWKDGKARKCTYARGDFSAQSCGFENIEGTWSYELDRLSKFFKEVKRPQTGKPFHGFEVGKCYQWQEINDSTLKYKESLAFFYNGTPCICVERDREKGAKLATINRLIGAKSLEDVKSKLAFYLWAGPSGPVSDSPDICANIRDVTDVEGNAPLMTQYYELLAKEAVRGPFGVSSYIGAISAEMARQVISTGVSQVVPTMGYSTAYLADCSFNTGSIYKVPFATESSTSMMMRFRKRSRESILGKI